MAAHDAAVGPYRTCSTGTTLPHALALEAEATLRWRTDVAEVGRRFAARTGRR